ncbi:hypothetical protein [Borreliella turdi]|uniref:hypothetical protein n=1 Tax=Borreliella turdi TaxID=57863 RepID=UPI001F40AE67|nr:hypothetical protein [Borreliella turdi]
MKMLIKKLKAVLFSNAILFISCVSENDGHKLVFKLNIGSEPATLDAQLINDSVGSKIVSQMFLGILVGDPKTGGYRPGLAKSSCHFRCSIDKRFGWIKDCKPNVSWDFSWRS